MATAVSLFQSLDPFNSQQNTRKSKKRLGPKLLNSCLYPTLQGIYPSGPGPSEQELLPFRRHLGKAPSPQNESGKCCHFAIVCKPKTQNFGCKTKHIHLLTIIDLPYQFPSHPWLRLILHDHRLSDLFRELPSTTKTHRPPATGLLEAPLP